jgi:hypothetical protein
MSMQDLLVRICREVEDEYGGDVGSLVIGPREKECCLLKNEGKMRNVCHIERWFKVMFQHLDTRPICCVCALTWCRFIYGMHALCSWSPRYVFLLRISSWLISLLRSFAKGNFVYDSDLYELDMLVDQVHAWRASPC